MPWYTTGTVSVTNGSATVTGSGTAWTDAIQAGWGFVGPDGRTYEIASIASATSLTLQSNYQGSTASGQSYACFPTMSLAADLTQQIQTLISDFQTVVDKSGAGLFADGTLGAPGIAFDLDRDTGLRRPGSNQIAMTAGGADKLLINGSAASGDGVQSSALDTTVGRLLTTGAFGLGALSGPLISDVDSTDIRSGFFRVSAPSGTLPAGEPTAGRLKVHRYDGTYLIAQEYQGTSSDNIWVRRYRLDAGGWQAWRPLTPIRTSGANGDAVKFHDGTLVCAHSLVTDANTKVTWTFPAAFISTPEVIATPNSSTARSASAQDITSADVGVNAWNVADQTRDAVTVMLQAVGRWL